MLRISSAARLLRADRRTRRAAAGLPHCLPRRSPTAWGGSRRLPAPAGLRPGPGPGPGPCVGQPASRGGGPRAERAEGAAGAPAPCAGARRSLPPPAGARRRPLGSRWAGRAGARAGHLRAGREGRRRTGGQRGGRGPGLACPGLGLPRAWPASGFPEGTVAWLKRPAGAVLPRSGFGRQPGRPRRPQCEGALALTTASAWRSLSLG